MTTDSSRKILIPLGMYHGLKRVGSKSVPVDGEIDETPHGFDVATITLNGNRLSFPDEYDEAFEFVFTCPPLDTVNTWIHEDEEHAELRAMTIHDLREKKLLFAVSQDSIGDGLLNQIYLLVNDYLVNPDDQPEGWEVNVPSLKLVRFGNVKVKIMNSTLSILADYHAGNHDPLAKVCDKIAKRMKMNHTVVEDYFASDLPLLVKAGAVAVNMHEGEGAPSLTPAERTALKTLDDEYRNEQQQQIEKEYGKVAQPFRNDEN
jgi:hypothetical protein